ncbi:MAG: outer membrane lipoprotein carrier protein LolA [Myxococcales bacterium]|nr:outer membrane lipoprotein carrier protein LolA [Myxococcales bacterium]
MNTLCSLLLLLAPPAAAPSAAQVADGVQKFYETTTDFQASFRQEYQSKALGQKKQSTGFVYIKKPGRMRWDYRTPQEKHFVADGTALYIYDPELEQVMVQRSFSDAELSTAVTFLWGRGKLREEFEVAFATRSDLGGPEHWVLELTPRKPARFSRLFFVVEKQTYRVSETLVLDPGGNENHLFFSRMAVNVGLKDEAFRFDIPPGVEVIEAPRP